MELKYRCLKFVGEILVCFEGPSSGDACCWGNRRCPWGAPCVPAKPNGCCRGRRHGHPVVRACRRTSPARPWVPVPIINNNVTDETGPAIKRKTKSQVPKDTQFVVKETLNIRVDIMTNFMFAPYPFTGFQFQQTTAPPSMGLLHIPTYDSGITCCT